MAEDYPLVTVVMPVRNEGAYIERSLGAVLAQDYPTERVEILIADGMSEDDTRERIEALAGERDVRIYDNPGLIVSTGLNKVIAEARGELIVRVDGHCEVAPDYVRQAVEALSDATWSGVGGGTETIGEDNVSHAIAAAMSSGFGTGGAASRMGRSRPTEVDTILFPAYPRRVLQQIGPFDPELVRNQDDELNHRLRAHGHRLLHSPALCSRYYCRKGLRALWRQYFQYGYFKVRVLQKHPLQMQARHFVPPLFVLAILLAAMLTWWTVWPALALAVAYLGLNLTASVLTVAAMKAKGTPLAAAGLLPVIYGILHLSYGSGFMVGLFRFAGRWGE